jgi:ankyrin repeat protein
METELLHAVKAKDWDDARAIARKRPDLIEIRDEDGLLPAVQALYRGATEVANELLPKEAELNVFEAALFGRVKRLLELLEESPPLATERSGDGFTALHLAVFSGQAEAARVLITHRSDLEAEATGTTAQGVRPIHTAAFAGERALAELLLDAGADVNSREAGGFTALHSAAENGDEEMVRFLLSRGADTALLTNQGKTAAGVAREAGRGDLAALLP